MKRFREETGDEPQETEYDYKKPRTLPFRTSPTVKHTLLFSKTIPLSQPRPFLTSDITPVESSEDEDQQPPYPSSSPCAQFSSQLTTSSSLPRDMNEGSHADSDMDMIDSQPQDSFQPCVESWDKLTTPPRPSPFTLLPGPPLRDSQDTALGGRIPTPRWGHFRSIDTSVNMIDAPNDVATLAMSRTDSNIRLQMSNTVPPQDIHPALSYTNIVNPPQSQLETDHSLFLHRRRLPSPISEDENMVSPTAMTEGSLDRRDFRCNVHDFSEQSIRSKPWAKNERNMTLQNSGKLMLSMGFRADCDKCRTRVPGHYNHVIRV